MCRAAISVIDDTINAAPNDQLDNVPGLASSIFRYTTTIIVVIPLEYYQGLPNLRA